MLCVLLTFYSLLSAPTVCELDVAPSAQLEEARGNDPESVPTKETEAPTTTRTVWDELADCESGNWIDGGRSFQPGSARWDWAAPGSEVPPWGTTLHHGGLQFHPDTWSWLAPQVGVTATHAYSASREDQIKVAEKTLEVQGWGAWPTCARKLGLR
jgi:hypothetical protein